MGSESPLKLPIIDFSKQDLIEPGTPAWNSVKTQVHQALEQYGCFEASFNKVPAELCKALFNGVQELFELPLEIKLRNSSKKPFHGYIGQYPMVPLFESMGIDDAPILEKVESFTNLLWPQGNPSFCKTIQSFSEKLSELDQIVRRMVLESLSVEKYLDEHLESTDYLLRIMKYKGPQTTETKLGLDSHKDKNIVTILCQNQVDGLQVQTKDGEWINIKPSQPDSFLVMIGDSFHAWTNGRLHSSYHRVMMTGTEARYSVGLFSNPKKGYIIKSPEELVDEEHPLLFKPFDFVEFLRLYHTETGEVLDLKTFCGV